MSSTAIEQIEPQLTDADLARILKRSIASIKRDRLTGKGPVWARYGKSARYDPHDVRAYLESLKRRTA